MSFDQYISLFFRLFHVNIPCGVIVAAVLIATCASTYLYIKRRKYLILPWIVACIFLMLYSTVIGREPHLESHMQLTPFWSIGAIQDGYIETLYEKTYNVLFFVPYGGLLAAFMGSNGSWGSNGSKGFKGTVLIGFLTSVGIELLQLITRTGTCETDDVICNTVGCALGAGMACLILEYTGCW